MSSERFLHKKIIIKTHSYLVLILVCLIISGQQELPNAAAIRDNKIIVKGLINSGVHGHELENDIKSIKEYDTLKNCTTERTKHPNSIEYLTYFNCGRVLAEETKDGQTVREFTLIVEENQNIPISYEGHKLDSWTFNGTVPGPTIRVTEGDLVKVKVINSKDSKHPHSLHMHSIHPGEMDGVEGHGGTIAPGDSFTYEFIAQPYGVYPYHCHVNPIADHINRGLYGMIIIDPKEPRPQTTEFAMMMNAYDLNYEQEGPTLMAEAKDDNNNKEAPDGEEEEEEERGNEIYTVNGKAFDYMHHPIQIETGKPYRIYLVNMVEFDLINSFHLHGNMFDYITAGTDETPDFKTDIVTLSQGDRGILEFQYDIPGRYMFHAHVTEFTDLGWMGFFDVKQQQK